MTTMAHHVPEEWLLEYSVGRLDSAPHAVIVAHVQNCAECQRLVTTLEAAAGDNLMQETAIPLPAGHWDKLLSAVGMTAPIVTSVTSAPPVPQTIKDFTITVPESLRHLLPAAGASLRWQTAGVGVQLAPLTAAQGWRADLMYMAPGTKVPTHTHRGVEMMVVLGGGFNDARHSYQVGDFALFDSAIQHAPYTDADEGCLCLVVRRGRLHFTGMFGRFLNFLPQ